MQRITSFTTLVALLAICDGCRSQSTKLPSVDLSDGVSQPEAMIIAQSYSEMHLGGVEITNIENGGDHWIAEGKLGGFVAKPLSFDIDKYSGKITSQVGPSYDSSLDINR